LVRRIRALADLGREVLIVGARCSPHTFAINGLRNGGDVFSLKELLRHTDLEMVQNHLAIAQAEVEAQHRRYSPVEAMLGKKKKRR